MEWKNNLTRTPYLVLFVVLIAICVGTASAMITITLAGNVVITDNLIVDTDTLVVDSTANNVGIGTNTPQQELDVDGNVLVQDDLYVGTSTGNDDDRIYVDDGSNWFSWTDGSDRFKVTNDFNIDGVLDAGGQSTAVPYNRIGFHQTDHGLSTENDLFVHNDFEVDGDIFADGDFECSDCIDSTDITNGTIKSEDIANGAAIKSITLGGEWFASCNECADGAVVSMISTSNSMCFLTDVYFRDLGVGEHVDNSRCSVYDNGGTWEMIAWGNEDDEVVCQARCLTWN